MEDDDPFDFKIGVEKNVHLKSGKKTATEAMMNSMMMKPSSTLESSSFTSFGEEEKKTMTMNDGVKGIPESKAPSFTKTDEDQKKKKNDDDDDAKVNATIESFSTETKVILTTLGKILERLEALELVALRNAKEVARVENALHGFIVGQARKENGKEPITSANLFAVVDSSEEEEEEEEEEEKIEEEIKENIVLRAGSGRSRRPPTPEGAHHPPHYPPHNPPPHHPPPPHAHHQHHQDPYGPPSFARGGRGGPPHPHPPPPPHERSGSPSGESAAHYPGIDHHLHPHPHRSPPPPHHGGPSSPPPHHGHPPPPSHVQHDPYGTYHPSPPPPPQVLASSYPSPPPPSPPQVQNEDIPLDVIVGEFASMGFTRDEVMTVLGKMEARNEQKEMNSILDKLMAGEGKL
jgi:hypothetical protein